MTHHQKALRDWNARREFVRLLREAASKTPCPMASVKLWFGECDHSGERDFPHESKIYYLPIADQAKSEPFPGSGCACHAAMYADECEKALGPKPRK